ncbi:Crp/Fnr family transcriptional regulator [Flavobacteriaceae bacterium S356]|uniref:Crp/Fnr family transcriptional regulator n=1 Tax=Asprobacillus argus TaxID=3076534 RepID=A0ABU3LDQ8_9FLAO|nr:Crp/Fnr family transcriptional regulator [Flavobacteriaceae bacterium S356]
MIRTHIELLEYIEALNAKGLDYFKEETFEPKQVIIEENKRYSYVYIIKKGITKVYLSDENGKDFIQEFLSEGMEFGELEVFSGKPSFCRIESITNVIIYKISYTHFNRLLETDKHFNRLVLKGMAKKISYKAPRHSYQHSYPIEDNIVKLKEMYPEIEKVITKKDIASYLGITLRSLNRTLSDINHKDAK